jgi:hypothetical protein
MLNRFLKVSVELPTGIAMVGVTNSELETVVMSVTNASFGAVSGVVAEVTHGGKVPTVVVAVQPAGRAGAVTPSKFCVAPVTGDPIVPSRNVNVTFPRSITPSCK